LGYADPNFKYQIFYFRVYGDMVEEIIMFRTNNCKNL